MNVWSWFKNWFKPTPKHDVVVHHVTWQGSQEDLQALENDRRLMNYIQGRQDVPYRHLTGK